MLSGFLQRWLLTTSSARPSTARFSLVQRRGLHREQHHRAGDHPVGLEVSPPEDDAPRPTRSSRGRAWSSRTFVGGGVGRSRFFAGGSAESPAFENAPGLRDPGSGMVASDPAESTPFTRCSWGQPTASVVSACRPASTSDSRPPRRFLAAARGGARARDRSTRWRVPSSVSSPGAVIILVVRRPWSVPPRGSGPLSRSPPLHLHYGSGRPTRWLITWLLNYDLMLLRKFAGAVAMQKAGRTPWPANYEALRNIALLPYQAAAGDSPFVVFPWSSTGSTFSEGPGGPPACTSPRLSAMR